MWVGALNITLVYSIFCEVADPKWVVQTTSKLLL